MKSRLNFETLALWVAWIVLIAGTQKTPAQASFTRVLTGPVAKDVEESVGCAWGDYDNDGFLDLFVVNFGYTGTNTLYHNNRDGSFSRIQGRAPVDQSGGGHGCAWADFDNDGFLDLYVAGLLTTNRLYRNRGDGTFDRMVVAASGSIASDNARSVSAAWADFDRDGNIDLFVANGALGPSLTDFLYRNLGDGRFSNIAPSGGLNQALPSTQGTWADIDGDGHLDLFVTHYANVGNYIYRNQGDGSFQVISNGTVLTERLNSVGSAWGDYDNDGDLDLFVVNRTLSGPLQKNVLYRNTGGGVFEKITTGSIVTDVGVFNTCAWVDYDNDGFLDMFVVNEGSRNRLYHNNGDGTFERVTQGRIVTDIANSSGATWGDYDNDGFLDLFVANGGITDAEASFLYHNDGNTNHWIKLRCVGTISNRSAIGAIIRATSMIRGKLQTQMRQISGGDGWLAQNALDVSIGFGDATQIDVLRIEWPSGLVQEYRSVELDQTLIVEEPALLRPGSEAGELILRGGGRDAFGQFRVYDIEASVDLAAWSVLGRVVVTNADGTAVWGDNAPAAPRRFYRARRSRIVTN